MKRQFLVLLIGFSLQSSGQESDITPLDLKSALTVMRTTQAGPHDAFYIIHSAKPLPESIVKLSEIHTRQIKAAAFIEKAHVEVNLNILLPMLALCTDTSNSGIFSFRSTTVYNIDAMRGKWPIFALILDMPNAATLLEKYSLDKSYSLLSHFNAFHILNHLDKHRAENVARVLKADFEKSPLASRSQIVDNILLDKPGTGFDGPVPDDMALILPKIENQRPL